jgi:PAS domain S-box-containing protein
MSQEPAQLVEGHWCNQFISLWCQNLEDGIVFVDTVGDILTLNTQAEVLFGLDAGTVIGKSVTELIPSLNATMFEDRQVFHTYMATGIHAGGTHLPLEITFSVFQDQGHTNYLLLVHNIMESHQLVQANGKNPMDQLSPREYQVVRLVIEGRTSREIADSLTISTKTVERHRANVMFKLGTNNVVELVRLALANGLG